ncbi:MAG: right-handed parallel beta-helix repeat-containing protein [Thermoplasmata archaeon]|nr:right-handed parallel beta-helix repeat-containing protein [Thermoplasmata archaeon]
MKTNRPTANRAWATALVVVVAAAGVTVLLGMSGTASATPPCNLTVNSENLAHNAVQSAINSANPGWRICVGAGSFPEQLHIATKGITLVGAGTASTSIDPASVNTTTVDWDSPSAATPLAAVVLVDNTTGVTIAGMTIDGTAASSSIGGCSPDFVGVDFQNSSGTLQRAVVTGIQLGPSLLGCQNQLAVYAYTGWFATHNVSTPVKHVTIGNTVVSVYGKNAITCDDPGLTCTLNADTTTGIGPTSATAQNGVQIAYGAVGHLTNTKVSGDNYTGSGSTLDWYGTGAQATGILLYDPGSGTTVVHSTVTACPDPIAEYETTASSVQIVGNSISGDEGYGIVVNGAPGTTALIENNTVNQAATGAPGILVDNGTFNVSRNTVTHVQSGGTNGGSQVVCGTGSYLSCPSTLSIATAAVQAVSEGIGGPTSLTLWDNTFHFDSLTLATVAMPTGSVTVLWV